MPRNCRRHLHHLGVEALAHLHTAGAHAYAAVLVNMHQCARMVHRCVGEGDPETDGHDGHAFLVRLAFRVEGVDLPLLLVEIELVDPPSPMQAFGKFTWSAIWP
jgi:hypothetical protein